MNPAACPNCGSLTIQSLDLVYQSGLSHTTSTAESSGIGLGAGGIAVGGVLTDSKGIQQTELSRRAAPPPNVIATHPALLVGCVGLIVSFVVGGTVGSTLEAGKWSLLITVAGVVLLLAFHRRKDGPRELAYRSSLAKWKRSAMCLRCGHMFEASN